MSWAPSFDPYAGGTNDPFPSRSLRLVQLALACLFRLEQPRVLDGDHSLVSEGLQQRDPPFREGQQLRPTQEEAPDRLAFVQEREGQHCSLIEARRNLLPERIFYAFALGREIVNVYGRSGGDRSAGNCVASEGQTLEI